MENGERKRKSVRLTGTMKYAFYNDYSEGAHPKVLEALQQSNLVQESGYGLDSFTKEASDSIRRAIGQPGAEVHFVSGGTQANIVVLASALKSHEAIIAADTGHINVHEAGAIEATGHKIISVPNQEGKLTPAAIDAVMIAHNDKHLVKPRLVFISNTTELGTVYTISELTALSQAAKKHWLYFYLDGARLGSALTAPQIDYSLADLAALVDAFYIGGTKNGALLGEAIVINHSDLQKDFRYHLKQRGALLAKGRAISLQFKALFTDNLYFEIATHANRMATMLADAIKEAGYNFLTPPASNQIFPVFPNGVVEDLQKDYGFYVWSPGESKSAIRLVTSWATREYAVQEFIERLKSLKAK